ncbi:MAG: hypothetical protein KC457_11890 [Myxococcales bacterium]|nr:hypothetical protein [Myxococcales bacterium]
MSNKALPLLLSCLAALAPLALSACDAGDDESSDFRGVLFDAEEVNDILAENPDERFFVDLRDGTRYGFDQGVESMSWDNFLVQCPSMAAPMPMPDYIRMLDLDVSPDFWTIQSVLVNSDGFRSIGTFDVEQDDMDCEEDCSGGSEDCVWVCSN